MTSKEFDNLCKKLEEGSLTSDEVHAFIRYAIELRGELIHFIGKSDSWDLNLPILGYTPFSDDESVRSIESWRSVNNACSRRWARGVY